MERIQEAMGQLAKALVEYGAETVRYTRCGKNRYFQAIRCPVRMQEETVAGTRLGTQNLDFLIPVAVLKDNPQVGDWVQYRNKTYEVLDLTGEGCWQRTACQQFYRIHTKLINTKGGTP